MIKFDYATELKKIGWGMLYLVISIFIMVYFKFDWLDTIGYVLTVSFGFSLFAYYKTKVFDMEKYLQNATIIIIFISTIHFLGRWGILGLILAPILVCAFVLWSVRKQIKEAKEKIEAMIWGKPLKEFRSAKDLPKIKIRYR